MKPCLPEGIRSSHRGGERSPCRRFLASRQFPDRLNRLHLRDQAGVKYDFRHPLLHRLWRGGHLGGSGWGQLHQQDV